MRVRDTVALFSVVLLCLPSIGGAIALLVNGLNHRPIQDWGVISSVSVAIAAIFGFPLLLFAIVICGLTLLSGDFAPRVKFTNVLVLGFGIVALFAVTLRR